MREQLGLTVGQVAWAVGAFWGRPLHPGVVMAWEVGEALPDTDGVRALAAALWCEPADLVGEPRTLLQCRTLARLTLEQAAAEARMPRDRYAESEARGRWRGSPEQTAGMVAALRPPPAVYVAACGLTGRLRVTLREAVTSWWPNYLGPLGRIVPVRAADLERALDQLHRTYQRLDNLADAGHGQAPHDAELRAAAFLDRIDQHLWDALRGSTG
ncbi:helix-turn-helix domain-containing protein [Streptomyces sp. NPDC015130]|uniref:helix-turn-helix domain-containing protein n=1 Tax=Streptomyces sp. NPDC015130 TaxID=3364940 RepID=UPI0036FF24A6